MDLWETLNSAYVPLYRRVHQLGEQLGEQLSAAGYAFCWNWYAFHLSRREDGFQTEFFPIPVITVGTICDIGLEPDHIFVEGMLSRAQTLAFDWSQVSHPFEVYSTDDYCGDLYRPGMSPDQLRESIAQDGSEKVGVQLILPLDCPDKALFAVIADYKRWNMQMQL